MNDQNNSAQDDGVMGEGPMDGRCMKCKDKRDMKDGWRVVTNARGSKAAKGECSECGTGMYKFLPKEDK